MLADMPGIKSSHLDILLAAFRDYGGNAVIRACSAGRPGHPVILPRALHAVVRDLRGDVEARDIIERGWLPVVSVEIGQAALQDIDTLADLVQAGGTLPLFSAEETNIDLKQQVFSGGGNKSGTWNE